MRLPLLTSLLALAACSPPAADAYAAPDGGPAEPRQQARFTPLPSPDVTGALWAPSTTPDRILYGKPGETPLIALACEQNGPQAHLTLTRFARAPEGGKAVYAVDGNGYIGRFHADATEVGDAWLWQARIAPDEYKVQALKGPRSIEATVPGTGTVVINQNELPRELIERCEAFNSSQPPAAQPSAAPPLPQPQPVR